MYEKHIEVIYVMKKTLKFTSLLLALVMMISLMSGCTNPKKEIVGKWMDSASMSGYEFNDDGTVKVIYVNLTIPVLNVPVSGSVVGTYQIEKETLSITYSLYSRTYNKIFSYEFRDKALVLTELDTGNSSVYIRQEQSASDVTTEQQQGIQF